MAMTIRVNPSVLENKSRDISGQIDKIDSALKAINEQITSSKTYWEGEASNTHQRNYKSLQDEINNVIKELRAHPRALLTMAGIFTKVESEAKEQVSTLSSDVI